MYLYSATARQFIEDALQGRTAEKLRVSYLQQVGHEPGPAEVASWRNSHRALSLALQHGDLLDIGLVLEYQLPLSSMRLDALLVGRSSDGIPQAVVVELKQWDRAELSDVPECVSTGIGGRRQEKLHPSRQVLGYQEYLVENIDTFTQGAVRLSACCYLHNLQSEVDTVLTDVRYQDLLTHAPLFAGDETDVFLGYLRERIGAGDGGAVLAMVLESRYRASKKLLEQVAAMIRGERTYQLLDEQQVVYNVVLAAARTGYHSRQKVVVLAKGGPGTGKSVIALNLVADLSAEECNTHHVTGSRAFTLNIRDTVGTPAHIQFRYFNNYTAAEYNAVDVLVADEAHRLRPTSNGRFTKVALRSHKQQIDELLHAAKVSVFFIDDLQVVRPGEVGSAELIREAAQKAGATLLEYQLEAQFRCNGSDGFINWVDHTLGIRETANQIWDTSDPFEFRIFENVRDLDAAIRSKAREGYSARLTAGYCWPWSHVTPDGQLLNDVVVDGLELPWNARPNSGRLARGIPASDYWATDPNGLNQVGCVYTAQGFEFDYVGVIFGTDLAYDQVATSWTGYRERSKDPVVKRAQGEEFLRLVKNTYRVLLTRGLKGCYVYFQDQATRDYVQSRTSVRADTRAQWPVTPRALEDS